MGKFEIIFLLSVVTCVIISAVQSVPVSDSSVQSENAEKCKKLCGFCGCTGYYCGDECLCECNSVTDGEAQCVDTMKSNCKKLALPFEVLVQGPNVNRLVRSLLYANPDEQVCVQSSESNKEKRSTISIYKPDGNQQKDEILTAPKIDEQKIYEDDSPIHVIVGQKFEKEIYPMKIESFAQDTETQAMLENVESESLSTMDGADRTNAKRHIIDVNQDISDFAQRELGDSFLYKRDATEESVAAPKDETVASPKEEPKPVETVSSVPAKPTQNFRKTFDAIPSAGEIIDAWEGFRSDVNLKISRAIDVAQSKAAELRAKFDKTSIPTKNALPDLPSGQTKYNGPFFRLANDDLKNAGLKPAVQLLPYAPWSGPNGKNAWNPKGNNNIGWNNKGWNNNGWNNNKNWLVGSPADDSVGSPKAEEADAVVGAAAPEITPAPEAVAK